MNSNLEKQKFFVIYQIINLLDNRIYIGAHSTFNVNDKYMGSSKHLKKDIKELGRQNFKKEILHIFDNKEDMIEKEAEIVNREFCHRIDTYNKMIGGISELSWNDMIVVKDKDENILSVYNDDPRWLSGELVGIAKGNQYTKGKVPVKDVDGNIFHVDVTDFRYFSGELVHTSKGKPGNSSFRDKNHSEETKKKMSESASKRIKNSMDGKQRTDDFKMKVKEKLSKSFFVYDKEGNFVSEEKNIKEYAFRMGMNPSSIVKVLKGKYQYSGNYKFTYNDK